MPTVYKVLGQSNPAATTLTNIYTVPPATNTIVSTISVCNQASSSATFRIAIRPDGAGPSAANYIYYGTPINANDGISITIGITMDASDIISVYSSTSTLSFSVFGSEIS